MSDQSSRPFLEDEAQLVLESASRSNKVKIENHKLKRPIPRKYDFSNFIGRSSSMQRIFEIIAKVAAIKITVLISGPSGTGKEMVARSIHLNSPRRDRPFIAINCGAVPGSLLESEFFGHAKGAFSGAYRVKKGLFEEADKGTLFLDEVSELPLDLQVKILRVIQEEEIRRLGEGAVRKLDFRIIAATNKPLEAEVRADRFREDLFYRLNVIHLTLPPLRERIEDIPLLAQHFLDRTTTRIKLGFKKLSAEAIEALTHYHWPGNVRELINVIEQAAIMSEGPIITLADLPLGPAPASESGIVVAIPEDRRDLKTTLKKVTALTERILIQRILEQTGQNRTRAAKRLGISRRALISKLQLYDLASASPNRKKSE
ncbi:MAG: sigma-54-dependent Fis family transcriptional regulator [Deltaproteobacteria bacterium]|nr:sigma-54-dependent Fis family transcriptional regulator [Deltaproteobacteria bacterium]